MLFAALGWGLLPAACSSPHAGSSTLFPTNCHVDHTHHCKKGNSWRVSPECKEAMSTVLEHPLMFRAGWSSTPDPQPPILPWPSLPDCPESWALFTNSLSVKSCFLCTQGNYDFVFLYPQTCHAYFCQLDSQFFFLCSKYIPNKII